MMSEPARLAAAQIALLAAERKAARDALAAERRMRAQETSPPVNEQADLEQRAISGETLRRYNDEWSSCPKCGGFGSIDHYARTSAYTRDDVGHLIVVPVGGHTEEHLVVCCRTCGWEWLLETKDARAT